MKLNLSRMLREVSTLYSGAKRAHPNQYFIEKGNRMTNRRVTLICSAAIAAAAIALTSTASFSQSNAAHLVGSWKGAVTPTSPPGLQPLTSLITFTSDGTMIESRRLFVPVSLLGPLLETPGHGAWGRVDDREIDVHFVFLLQGAVSGSDMGTDNVHLRLRLDSTGTVLSGTFDSTIRDTSGNPVFTASGTYRATQI
jgi:hypothetical protein